MSETQLERSVLEAKEREELVAIADALGAKPTARAKKSDLITQILRATGVESEGATEAAGSESAASAASAAPAAPAKGRTRARKPASGESGPESNGSDAHADG